jgi:hypothetical protein
MRTAAGAIGVLGLVPQLHSDGLFTSDQQLASLHNRGLRGKQWRLCVKTSMVNAGNC